jgi:virulence-associated protein VapD
MSRRNFIRGVGLFGAIAAGALAGAANSAPAVVINNDTTPKTDPNVVKKLEEQGNSHLSLRSTYGDIEPPKPPPVVNGYNFSSSQGNFYIVPNGVTQAHLTVQQEGNIIMGTNYKKFVPGTEKTIDVKMMPGPDGHLYVNVNGEWKRVLTSA